MDPAGRSGSGPGGENGPSSQLPFRACCLGSGCCANNRKVPRVCRYFQEGFCFRGGRCRYQHPRPPALPEWGCRHSDPHVTLLGPQLGLTSRTSGPIYLPTVTVDCSWAGGTESGLEEVGGTSWKSLSLSPADGQHSHSQESDPVQGHLAPPQSPVLEDQQGKQDSQDVVCGICMDKVWDKPEAERVFGILPNCTHAHCLGCLRTWRKNHQDLPLDVIKACPQCRVHSSYIIPYKFWVSEGARKEQLIRSFKARTSQIRCRFFMRRSGRCPFKSDCIYLHQLPAETLASGPPWPKSDQLASGSEVLGPALFLWANKPEEDVFFTDCALTMALWGSELLLDLNSFYHGLLQPVSA